MAADKTAVQPRVVLCACAYFDVIPQASKGRILGTLQAGGVAVESVADLCDLAAKSDPRLQQWAQADSLAIVACFPRAVRWLFAAAGAPLDIERVRVFNMRTQSPEEVLTALQPGDAPGDVTEGSLPQKDEGWVPWFPVIDRDRCKNCKQCMNFCLFGVYGLSPEGQVQVQNPSGCKTNCPACARMCPASAIIFPKYGDAPINGDEVTKSVEAREKPSADLSSLLRGNVYDTIRRRQAPRRRFSTEPQEPSATGADRFCPTIDALRRDLDIPDDVLRSLSPAELKRIREASQQKRPSTTDSQAQNQIDKSPSRDGD
jgi:NAD-dependent dihydropyrimidine dehydrogenase PreA subunit